MSSPSEKKLEELLVYVRQSRGFDFRGYKRSSLVRRVTKRMEAVNRRGKAIRCAVTCTPFLDADGGRQGVVLLMEELEV